MLFKKKAIGFPNDANGDVLKRMYKSGMDLTIEYEIEFFHVFSDKASAEKMCEEAYKNNFKVFLTEYDESWDVCCIKKIVPKHKTITDTESYLGKIAERYNGTSDGWGVLQE